MRTTKSQLTELLERALRALHEDDFPALREEIRQALKGAA